MFCGVVQANLEYRDLVKPEHPVVEEVISAIGGPGKVLEWMLGLDHQEWCEIVHRYHGGYESRLGVCFSHAVFVCALLAASRNLRGGVYVIVTCHRGEDFGQALHAGVVQKQAESWLYIDMSRNEPSERLQVFATLMDLTRYNRCICLFNNYESYLSADEEGLVSDQ